MNANDATQALLTLVTLPSGEATNATDPSDARVAIVAIAKAAGLPADGFVPGDPAERTIETMARAMGAWGRLPQQAVKAVFFALSTDPGDVDDYGKPDQSPDQTPRPGFLSAYGASFAGVERGGQTVATSLVTIRNAGTTATAPFTAGALTLEATGESRSDGGTPTYVTTDDPSIYVGIGGTLVLAPGASAIGVPVRAVQIGIYGSALANGINLVVTQSYGNLVVTASTVAVGAEREERKDYISRCLLAPDKIAPGGPQKAYRFAMNTARDGTVLQDYDDSGPTGIVAAQVTTDSPTGLVNAYFADKLGGAAANEVRSANDNIQGIVDGVITDPLGVVPDCVTYTGVAAINTAVNITYSARILAAYVPGGATAGTYTTGGSPPAQVLALFNSILAALQTFLPSLGPGGMEQDASGNGKVYTGDIQDTIKDSTSGLYAAAVTVPGTTTTAITFGHIAIAGTVAGTLVVV